MIPYDHSFLLMNSQEKHFRLKPVIGDGRNRRISIKEMYRAEAKIDQICRLTPTSAFMNGIAQRGHQSCELLNAMLSIRYLGKCYPVHQYAISGSSAQILYK